jgi:hypothetical protein
MLASGSGPGGRWFKSIRPDHFFNDIHRCSYNECPLAKCFPLKAFSGSCCYVWRLGSTRAAWIFWAGSYKNKVSSYFFGLWLASDCEASAFAACPFGSSISRVGGTFSSFDAADAIRATRTGFCHAGWQINTSISNEPSSRSLHSTLSGSQSCARPS